MARRLDTHRPNGRLTDDEVRISGFPVPYDNALNKRYRYDRVYPRTRKLEILEALKRTPLSRKDLSKLVGFYRLNEYLADLYSD